VIDPLHCEAGVQNIPGRAFIGMHGCPRRDMLADHRDCIGLTVNDPRPRIAAALASNNYDLPLGIHAAPVGAIDFLVRRLRTLADIGAVNLGLARQFGAGLDLRAHRLAQLVQEHESRLRIDVHVARHLQRGGAFDAVAEQRDHGEVIADCQLAAVEDRAAGHTELLAARRAFSAHRSFRQRVNLDATAVRAERVAIVGREPDPLEHRERFLIGQPQNLSDAQAPCGWRVEEVGHESPKIVYVYNIRG
jgi:hypothetical protein